MDFVVNTLRWEPHPATHIQRDNNQTTIERHRQQANYKQGRFIPYVTGKIMESFERLIWKKNMLLMIQDDPAKTLLFPFQIFGSLDVCWKKLQAHHAENFPLLGVFEDFFRDG